MQSQQATLAQRLGTTLHVSPLRRRLWKLRSQYPSRTAETLEDWLVDVANVRGARIVVRPEKIPSDFRGPPLECLSDEELVAAICQPHGLDRPQMLRLAAQLISRQAVRLPLLKLIAERERVESILAALAREALRVQPEHPAWQALSKPATRRRPVREPLLHWTRLAEPEMEHGRCNARRWRLVA